MIDKLIIQAKLGQVWFNVYVNSERDDADFTFKWEPTKANPMTIGLKGPDWAECRERLLHEAVEAALSIHDGCNYLSNEARLPAYIRFSFTHEQFQSAIDDANLFMLVVEPKLKAAFDKYCPDKPYIKGLELK